METELKMLVNPENAKALRQHPLLKKYALEQPHEQTLSGIYFDTPSYDLRHADAGLRVRQVDNDWVQTLKAGGQAAGGLHERQEWESKVNGPIPDLAALEQLIDPKSAYAKLIKKVSEPNRLLPTFTTKVKRTLWELRLPDGDEVECVIDQGSIEHGANKSLISELELELKSGNPKHLFDFALQLQRDVPMQIGNLSKADRGYALLAPPDIAAVKAAPLQLSPSMSVEEAFKAIINNCLSQIQANETGVTTQHDVESVHQMRVGLRRLRSALGMFKKVIVCPDELQDRLRWLGTELGAARDWDVLTEATLPTLQRKIAGKVSLKPISEATREVARKNHDTAAAAVLSPQYTELILMFYGWMQGDEWRASLTSAQRRTLSKPVSRFSDKTLLHDQERLLRRGIHLKGADPETRHQVRIAAKKTRYATEFFASLYPAKRVRPYVKALSGLQDELGWLNDAAVASKLLEELETAQPDLRGNIGFVRGYLACSTESDDVELCRLWTVFKPMPLPCKK